MSKNIVLNVIISICLSIVINITSNGLAYAEDIYYAQVPRGDFTGNSCTNAKNISLLTWGAGDSNIGAGDTAHLCGTITSMITIGASGSDWNNPITIKYEDGAKSSKAYWGLVDSSNNIINGGPAIYAGGKSYLVIDGGTNGMIENTNNGTLLGNQVNGHGISLYGCSHVEIKNLETLMYKRVENALADYNSTAVYFWNGSSDINIHNNNMHDSGRQVYQSARYPDKNITIHHNSIDNSGIGIVIGTAGTGETVDNVTIYNNIIHKSILWSGNPDIHTNAIQVFAVQSGSGVTNLNVHDNKFYGNCGTNSTSLLFIEGLVYSPNIYNNTLLYESNPGTGCGNGMMYLKQTQGGLVANNTFISTDNLSGIGLAFTTGNNVVVKYNIFKSVGIPISLPDSTTAVFVCDYNLFPLGGIRFNYGSYAQYTYDQWKSISGFDAHSTTGNPLLNPEHVPKAPSIINIK